MTAHVPTASLANIDHPAWCDSTRCSADVHANDIDVYHALAPVALPGVADREVYAVASGAEAAEIYSDGYPTDLMTPAQARALAAALVAVADAVDPEGVQ